ncbi:hypothetical protein V5R04_14160 [Jonesiaceae bacterium BS-20]|uniref:Uncharacterized protein n=1 Tax=Jonesiaceae bacterium BS-20 TaxID=3120821 RepID=A0AAU7DVP8_9MICO
MKFLVQYGPATAGLIIALIFVLLQRNKRVELPKQVRLLTVLSQLVATSFYIIAYATRSWPGWQLPLPIPSDPDGHLYYQAFVHMLPLSLTIVVLVFLILPIPTAGPPGSAALAPRGFQTFTSRRWITTPGVLILGSTLIAFIAGLASSPDEQGRYVAYFLRASEVSGAGTGIYGWWFSVPSLLLMGGLVVVAFLGVSVISRPALASDTEADSKMRTIRIRNILTVCSGGLLLHLATVFSSLAGTSALKAWFNTGDQTFTYAASFSSLGQVLRAGALTCLVLGLACWWAVLVSALTAKSSTINQTVAP